MVKKVGMGPTVNSIGNTNTSASSPGTTPRSVDLTSSLFRQVLDSTYKKNKIVFSAHARGRLEDRNIKLGVEDLKKITQAMDKAEAKGSRSPLLLYKDIALVASVPNRTIITAVDGAEESEQIYTGIDSAVIFQ